MRGLRLAASIAAAAAACAHEPKIPFGRDVLVAPADLAAEESDEPLPPPLVPAAPPAARPAPPAGPPLDGTLLSFAAGSRDRRARTPPGRGFPEESVRAWVALGEALDRWLQRPLSQTPLLELVRARITVEAELEFERRRYGDPPAAVRSAVGRSVERLASRAEAARAAGEPLLARAPSAALHWPLDGAGISSPYGMRRHPVDGRRRMHQGVDLVSAPGGLVAAAAPGFVVHAGWTVGHGLLVEVRHPGDLTSRYAHLMSLLCGPGDAVEAGTPIGLVGRTGVATGPHLHFEVWRGGRALDPLALLAGPAESLAR